MGYMVPTQELDTIDKQLIAAKKIVDDLAAAKKELEQSNPSLTGADSIPPHNSDPSNDDTPSLESDGIDQNKNELKADDYQGTASKTPTTKERDPIKVFFDMLAQSLEKLGKVYLAHQEYLHNTKTYRNNKTIDNIKPLARQFSPNTAQKLAAKNKSQQKLLSAQTSTTPKPTASNHKPNNLGKK